MKKKPRKLPPFETMYPTQQARHAADREFDKLPLSTTLGECIRVWDWHYLNAGGSVVGAGPT